MTANTPRILLLNTTNHFVRLAYPYAFVQVSEVARRYGIEVRRVDLHGIPGPQREAVLRRHVQQWAPALVGVTLRNTDSLLSTDYTRRSSISSDGSAVRLNLLEQMTQGLPPYYPVHDTRQLISQVRALTSAPIMVGGFGFSVQPQRSLEFLQADFGVIGDPDPVLARLDDVLARRSLETIDNLCWFDEGRVRANPSVFLGPSTNREWVDELVLDRNQFFGAVANNVPATARSIPIEVMRGCPHSCTFCSEPLVKGKRAQLRDLDVVEDELEFLRTHGHNLVWFICSEINAMKLATEPAFEKTRSVLLPEAAIRPLAQAAVETAIRIILRTLPGARRRLFEWLAVTTDECGEPALSNYRLTCRLYERFSQTDELRQEATRELGIEPNSLEQLALEDFLYRNNIQLRPAYRPFFVPERASSEPQAAE